MRARSLIKTAAIRLGFFRALRSAEVYVNARRGHVHDTDYEALRTCMREGDIADIGANIGQSIISLHRLFPNAHIHAFEPNPQCRAVLGRVIRLTGAKVDLHMCGLADRAGELIFNVPVTSDGIELLQEGSFDPRVFNEPLTRSRIGSDFTLQSSRIPVACLDDFPGTYALLKIDVQGLELAVLTGGKQTIERDRPVILLERDARSEESIMRFLAAFSYEVTTLHDNLLFRPRASLAG
jgi:FkbM family methyltransferase